MARKRDILVQQRQLKDLVGQLQPGSGDDALIFTSDHYMGIGCDLKDTSALSKALEAHLQLSECLILCTAEVSIAYMNIDAADALLRWSAQHDDVRFLLLEQCAPDGPEHPFAQKMLKHFENLRIPLNCVRPYPSLKDQESRFLRAGYGQATVQTLWDLWQDPRAVPSEERLRLNSVEPFDEWEEFALFGSHYIILEATKTPQAQPVQSLIIPFQKPNQAVKTHTRSSSVSTLVAKITRVHTGRRRMFGSIVPRSRSLISLHGGIGREGRQSDADRYGLTEHLNEELDLPDPPSNIKPRVCHTITQLSREKSLLVGGRTSPDQALSGCWLGSSKGWNAVDDLPIPLYRHCAVALAFGREEAGVLIFGGKTSGGAVVKSWFLWREKLGWSEVMLPSDEIKGRFGATMATTGVHCGVLLGGMTDEGILCEEIWQWEVTYGHAQMPRMSVSLCQSISMPPRIGACLVRSPVGLLLVGGVSSTLLRQEEEIICIEPKTMKVSSVKIDFDGVRPLLVGHAVYATENTVLIVGGGAICFSFGNRA
ncbi:MAG: hypothetical protein Q9220_007368 [cf. Caloplaca sp. 1 TL-2023]